MAINLTVYAGNLGNIVYVFSQLSTTGQPVAITGFAGLPSFAINGTPATITSLCVGQVKVTAQGAGYNAATTVASLIGGAGSGVVLTPVISGGHVTGLTISNAGWGFLSTDIISIAITDSGGGSGATATAQLTGLWADTTLNEPFVYYSLNVAVKPGDVLTYTCPANWLMTASGNAAAVSTPTIANNYVGTQEAGVGAYPAFGETPTMLTGVNVGFFGLLKPSTVGSFPFKNWRYRLDNPWTSTDPNLVIASQPDGMPQSWSSGTGIISSQFMTTTAPNGLDSTLTPGTCGQFSVVFQDPNANTVNAMQFWIGSGTKGATNCDTPTSGFGGGSYGAGINPTRTVAADGITVTITYPNIQRVPNNKTWGMGLRLYAMQAQAQWTVGANLAIFGPGNEDNVISNLATGLDIDNNFKRAITTPSGKVPFAIRPVLDFGSGILNVVNPGDETAATAFSWTLPPQPQHNVVAIRRLNTDPAKGPVSGGGDGTYAWVSPKIYSPSFAVAGTDSFGPYSNLAANDNGAFLDLNPGLNPDPWFVFEVRTAAPHGLQTGYRVQFPPHSGGTPNNIPWTGGAAGVSVANTMQPVWVTSPTTYLMVIFTSPASGSQNTIQQVAGTTEQACNFIANIANRVHAPFEAYADLCNQLGCNFYINLPAFLSPAASAQIANLVKAHYKVPGGRVYVSWVNELWNNNVYFDSYLFCFAGKTLWSYNPGIVVNQYYTTTTTPVGVYPVAALTGATHHDIWAGILGEAFIHRNFEGQWAPSSIPSNSLVAAFNKFNIPASEVRGAPYWGRGNNATTTAAANPGNGNWPVPWLCEGIRHEIKYDISVANIFTSEQTILQGYTGPTTGLGGVPVQGQVNGKPSFRSYEGSITGLYSSKVTNQVPLTRDTFYNPAYAGVVLAFRQQCQDGNPYSIGSGFVELTEFNLVGFWDGGNAQQFVYCKQIWQGQQPGTPGNTGNTNTTTFIPPGASANQSGVSPSTQQFTTIQGGGAINQSAAYDVYNDSWDLFAHRAWSEIANPVPTVVPPPQPPVILPPPVLPPQPTPEPPQTTVVVNFTGCITATYSTKNS